MGSGRECGNYSLVNIDCRCSRGNRLQAHWPFLFQCCIVNDDQFRAGNIRLLLDQKRNPWRDLGPLLYRFGHVLAIGVV